MSNRIIALIDMDCFYCQVECKINPSLIGKPLAVVQYNTWKGGGIIAVNYEARHRGVTRHMRGDEAKQHCPEIELCRVPSVRGKADISKYRNAGREVIAVLSEFSNVVERASIDEAYIDLTDVVHERMKSIGCIVGHQLSNTFVVGYGPVNNDEDARKAGVSEWLTQVYNEGDASVMESTEDFMSLAVAGVIVEEIRAAVLSKTQFHCSAGIAHNKVLAKLVCGLHKPQKQSILPHCSVPMLYSSLSIKKVRHLGGKLGDEVVEKLQCSTMIELEKFSLKQLQTHFDEKTASWLYYIVRGIDNEPVNARLVSKSIGCCKRFPGKTCLATRKHVLHWIQELADEMCERLEDDLTLNKRRAQLLTVSFTQEIDGKINSCSRSTSLSSYKLQDIVEVSMQVINRTNTAPVNTDAWSPPLLFLGLSASKFSTLGSHQSIQQFFKPQDHPEPASDLSSTEEQNHQHDIRKQEHVFTHFSKVMPFQLELNKIEKKLVEKFKCYIDLKLQSCSSKYVDKVVFLDIVTQIKSNATANVKKYVRDFSKTFENSSNNSKDEDTFSIEQKVIEIVEIEIEQSLKSINDILFNEKGENVKDKNYESTEKNCVSSQSMKSDEGNSDTFLIPTQTTQSPSSPIGTDNHTVNTPLWKKVRSFSDKHNICTPNTLDSIEFPFLEQTSTESTQDMIKRTNCDVITYTRRQINPENISDALSDDHCILKGASPQIITKSIDSIPIRKYETVEKNYPNVPNMFKNRTKRSPVKKNSETDLSNDSLKKEKSYSFFENYLRRKKEKERLCLMSCKDKHNHVNEQSIPPINQVNIHKGVESKSAKKNESAGTSDIMSVQDIQSNNHNDDSEINHSEPTNSCDLHNLERGKSTESDEIRFEGPSNYFESAVEHENIDTAGYSGTISTGPIKITCEKCNLHIDLNGLQEHQDYHYALELSNTMEAQRSLPSHSRSTISSTSKILNKKSSKRGRPSKLNTFQNSESSKKLKTIDDFFKPKSSSFS